MRYPFVIKLVKTVVTGEGLVSAIAGIERRDEGEHRFIGYLHRQRPKQLPERLATAPFKDHPILRDIIKVIAMDGSNALTGIPIAAESVLRSTLNRPILGNVKKRATSRHLRVRSSLIESAHTEYGLPENGDGDRKEVIARIMAQLLPIWKQQADSAAAFIAGHTAILQDFPTYSKL